MALLCAVGLIHAYRVTPAGVENQLGWLAAPEFCAVYLVAAGVLWGLGWKERSINES